MSGRMEHVIKNSFWGMACKFIQILCPFIVRTIMIDILGSEYTGLNGLFTSILKILSLTELGFSSAITYNMYEPIAHDNITEICSLLNVYKRIYRIVGFIILGIGIALLPFLKHLIYGSYPSEINIYVLYVIYLANTCLTYFLFAYRTSLLNAYQRYDMVSIISLISSLIMYILEIICLIITHSYYLYSFCALFTTVINNLLVLYKTQKLFPQITCTGNLSPEKTKDIKIRVKALLGHRIGTAIITSADNIVISSFLGLTAVTYFNNYYYIISALISIIDTVLGGMVATIGNYIALKSRENIFKLFNSLNYILLWVVGLFSICYGCMIQDFIEIWLGVSYQYKSSITLLLLVLYFYFWKIRSVNLRFKEAAGMWNDDFWKPYVSAIINIVLNIILVNIIGINGVLISTIVTMIFVNMPWEVHVLYLNLFKRKESEYYFKLIRQTITIVISGLITFLFCTLINTKITIARLFCKMIICIIIPNIIFILTALHCKEFTMIKMVIKTKLNYKKTGT